jgi:uncharacterized protein (DUF305 family)
MKRNTFDAIFACIAAGLFSGPLQMRAESPAPSPAQANYEVRFLTGMIDHHSMAVMMSMLCEERAVHAELLALCADIKAAQTEEIALMQGWLLDWYGIAYEPEMKPGQMKRMERLAELNGEEFEIEFMEMMIRHHAQAVREGNHCIQRAYHSELIALCESIVETQLAEIDLMEMWLCGWYGDCH